MPNWTKEQSQAIDIRKSNLLVSAAAGSGKTAVLVERIIKLITEDLIDIDKLLIVTFTKAAAGEMRERILKAIIEKIESKSDNEKHLRRQLNLLNKASITTLHSFCRDILKQNFHVIGVDSNFRIGDTTEKNIMISEVLDELMENEYEKENEDFIKLIEGFGGNKEDTKVSELILRIYFFIQSKPYPIEWLGEAVEMYNISDEEFEESLWTKTVKENIKIDLHGALNIIEEGIRICSSINGPVEYEQALKSDLINIKSLLISLDNNLEDFYSNIQDLSHEKFKSIRKDRKLEIDEKLIVEVKELRDDYKKNIIDPIKKNILNRSIDEQIDQIRYMYPVLRYLFYLIVEFNDRYSQRKIENGILDFNDLEHFALKILEDEKIANTIRDRFDYIFVDEYQDSNIVQETIINKIKRDNNLFLVGDVKQSIYRFRMADPSLFIEKYENYKDEEDINRRIILSNNFRSRYEILEGVNYIFKNLMSKTLGEIDYNKEAYLYKGIDFKEIDDNSIELNVIRKDFDDEEDIDEELKEMSDAETEARIIANRIKALLGEKTYKPKLNDYREIDYKDIVILLRATKKWAPVFMEILNEEGIPIYSDDSLGYFDVLEVKIFLNLLLLVDNKRQDIPLLSVMRSPIGKFTTEELIKIRINNRIGTYYEAIENYISNNDDELKIKLEEFLSLLNKLSEESRYLKLDEFIWKALIDTGYYYYVGAMPNGLQRQANLRILVERAEQFEKSSVTGLFNFIRFIDKISKSGSDLSPAKTLGENENVVRLMSIHKSKGLEFPVVIVAGLGKQFNLMDSREDVLLHKDLGLGSKYFDIERRIYSKTFPQEAIKGKMKIESLSEEMRVLYVALTRAVDKLILYGSVRNIEKQAKKWVRKNSTYSFVKARSFIDWIMTILSKHEDGKIIRDICGIESFDIETGDSKWSINIIDKNEVVIARNEISNKKEEYKNELIDFKNEEKSEYRETINNRFNWKYEYEESINIPSKVSVTDIKKATAKDIEAINYKIPTLVKMPKFLEREREFTPSEKGTIIHHVMQHLNLSEVHGVENIKNQINMMVIKDLLKDEEAKVVDCEKIKLFFESNIGKRILKSEKVYRETPFVIVKKASEVINGLNSCDENLLVQGIVDCHFIEDDNIILVDYKTDYISENNIQNIINRYKSQIYSYKEAIEKITKKKVIESYIYSFGINKEIRII